MCCQKMVNKCFVCNGILMTTDIGLRPDPPEIDNGSIVVAEFYIVYNFCPVCKLVQESYKTEPCLGNIVSYYTDSKIPGIRGVYLGHRCVSCKYDYGKNH